MDGGDSEGRVRRDEDGSGKGAGGHPWSIKIHHRDGQRTAEVVAEGIAVRSANDILDIIGGVLWHNEADQVALHAKNIVPEFFDLRTGLLGDVAQKCSNYRFRLAIVGDFDSYPTAALRAYISESNRGGLVLFARTLHAVLDAFGR